MILDSTALDAGSGDCRANAFILDMNMVFEAFVYRGLLEALGASENVFRHGHKGLTLDTGNQIGLEPDLSWWEEGQCRFVGDVKYKQLDTESFKQPDMYQMLAYMTATGLRESMLLYAGAKCTMSSFTFRHAGSSVHLRTLNPGLQPTELLNELRVCAHAILTSARLSSQ